jgi:hypothetical protein
VSIVYVTPRPPAARAIQWTGDNLAEFEDIANSINSTVTQQPDGSLVVNTYFLALPVPPNGWFVVGIPGLGNRSYTDAEFQANYQQLTDGTTHAYSITEG